jgi:hypothetical protein
MKRTIMCLVLTAILVLALAVPAFAQAEHFESNGPILGDCQGVVTPSGRENANCFINPEGGNKGGSGGGGADRVKVPVGLSETTDPEGQIVFTPSGNQILNAHGGP